MRVKENERAWQRSAPHGVEVTHGERVAAQQALHRGISLPSRSPTGMCVCAAFWPHGTPRVSRMWRALLMMPLDCGTASGSAVWLAGHVASREHRASPRLNIPRILGTIQRGLPLRSGSEA